jgi:hypothetical protein
MGKASRGKHERRLMNPGTTCDFCGLPPAWVFPTRQFQMIVLGVDLGRDGGEWKACDRCAGMVEARTWDVLVMRCIDFMVRRLGRKPMSEDQIIIYMMQLFNNVDANRIGPKQRWEPSGLGST